MFAHNSFLSHGVHFGKASKLPSHCLAFLSFSPTESLLALDPAGATNIPIPGSICLCHWPLLQKQDSHQHPSLPFCSVLSCDSKNAEVKSPVEIYDALIPFKETPSPGCSDACADTNFWKHNFLLIISTFVLHSSHLPIPPPSPFPYFGQLAGRFKSYFALRGLHTWEKQPEDSQADYVCSKVLLSLGIRS